MSEFVEITSEKIYKAVYDACFQANINLPEEVYQQLETSGAEGFEPLSKMAQIYANAAFAAEKKRPLCQDTGQVIIFAEIGQDVKITGENFNTAVNRAVSNCYKDKFLRKSVVKDALFDRTNTQDNTPAIIYTDIVAENFVNLKILIKGGGAENMSNVKMFNPSAKESEIKEFILETVKSSDTNACPPLFIGVGIGGTLDYAAVLSKKAFFKEETSKFESDLKDYLNKNSDTKCAGVKVHTSSTHIACMPVCVTLNCHSTRHAEIEINKDGTAEFRTKFAHPKYIEPEIKQLDEIKTCETDKIRALKAGAEVYLTGEIYTARDAAHQKLLNMIKNSEQIPFEIKNKIIFYAGPCPANSEEILGPIGPTTAKRMDKFASKLYDIGLLGTIGKGGRSEEVEKNIKKNNAVYFTVQGGVAAYLQNCVKKAEITAFEELGPEAVFRLEVEKLPVKIAISK